MPQVKLAVLKKFINELISAAGMNKANAEIFTDLYMRATLRGVGHHDIYDIIGRVSTFNSKAINPNPNIKLINKFEALEGYDGNNGPGELCCSFIMDRGMELAKKYGIGFCTIKNSNHFLSAAPYVEKAAEEGFFAMIFSRTKPCMGVPGSKRGLIGNCPMGFSSQTEKDYSVLLDICLSYASYGTINVKAAAGESVPSNWGGDAQGNPTTDPAVIANGGVPYPIGEHKGFGLALMAEILTGVMSGGQVIDEPNPLFEKGLGVYSQTSIVIKADGLIPMETYKSKVSEMIERLDAREPGIHIPGQSSFEKKTKMENEGIIILKPELVEQLNDWAIKLGVNQL